MLQFDLVGDACAQIVTILLVYVSILACCCSLCIFEKHMLAFVELIHALSTREGKYPIHVSSGSFASKERKNWKKCSGSLHSCIWELFFT
jgi:hypothetical protein